MHTDAAKELLEILLDYQYDMIWLQPQPWGMKHVEFLFIEAARIIELDPVLRSYAMQLIEKAIKSGFEANGGQRPRPQGFVLHEFIFFLAHRTRWSEFETLAASLKDKAIDRWRSNRLHTWSAQLNSALRDDWEDKDFYACFGGNTSV